LKGLKGVEQLDKLMHVCEKNLSKINTKALIIQGNKDPVVNLDSGKTIYDKIHSSEKYLAELNFSNHVIVTGEGKEEVFQVIRKFLAQLKLI
jgi:esterase/lipase